MSDPTKRVIEGCRHDRVRMTVWANEGACPICLTAQCGMQEEENAALRIQLAEAERKLAAKDAALREINSANPAWSAAPSYSGGETWAGFSQRLKDIAARALRGETDATDRPSSP